ncbi:MAG: protein kinase [Deltaproteobacteria bacterium]|nr:protein kinase [Deltaproteobacteria bacterium]
MDGAADRLKGLLAGQLDQRDEDELETELADRPSLRRQLADLALEAERTQAAPAIRILPDLVTGEPGRGDVDVGPLLGSGGMALVRLGRQLKLDRSVAVKILRPECCSEPDLARLLREARITGRLEHPNIVPVHDIVCADDGMPQVVLKLIEGHTWSELMDDADRVRELFGADDLLEWNLDVVMAVCRALAFAHSRGVLHRDVKPKNVMVGPFGEVDLVDWGIALELGEEDAEESVEDLSGTAAYMAPEQLGGQADKLGPWTDTYLLGATLYHALTGAPPHAGRTVIERITAKAEIGQRPAPPDLPEDIPLELRRITQSALEPDPGERLAHPEQLRLALTSFLQHRGALRLVERGHRERVRAALAHEEDDDAEWERASLAAELAYRASLEEWTECDEAAQGLLQLAELRVDHALTRDEPHVAARLLEAHAELSDEVQQRVAAAVAQAEDKDARLRRLVTDADRRFGHRKRGLFGAAFGLLWVVFWCVVAFVPPADVTLLVGFTVGFGVFGFGVLVVSAPQLFQNRINRTSMWVIVTGLTMTIVWCLGASWLGLDMRTVMIGQLLLCAFFTSGMASLMDPWGTVSVAGFAAAFLVAARVPAWTPWAVVGGNAVLLINQVVLNLARARRGFEKLPQITSRGRPSLRGADLPTEPADGD